MDLPREIPLSIEWIIIYFFGLAAILLPIIAIVDILLGRFKDRGDKLTWFLIVFFLNVLGAVLYFALGRRKRWKK